MKRYNEGYNFEISNNGNYKNKRHIPIVIMLRIWLTIPLTIIGIILLLFMLPFSLVFVSLSDYVPSTVRNSDPDTIAVITGSYETNASEGSDDVYKYTFQYKDDDGTVYSGTGYSSGEMKKVGEEIRIKFKRNNPKRYNTEDLRNSTFGGGPGVFVIIFQGISLIILYFGTRKAIRRIILLKTGELANGKLIKEETISVDANNKTVVELTFEFTASDYKAYQVVVRSVGQNLRLNDEGYEKLVYDPGKPENAVLLDQLPNSVKSYFLRTI